MLHDRQTQVVKSKRLLLPRIRLARIEAAQAIQLVKGRFFDRIRAFADSLNPPALKSDDNGADSEPVLNSRYEPPGIGPVMKRVGAVVKVLAMEPLVASWRMVRAALVGIR